MQNVYRNNIFLLVKEIYNYIKLSKRGFNQQIISTKIREDKNKSIIVLNNRKIAVHIS